MLVFLGTLYILGFGFGSCSGLEDSSLKVKSFFTLQRIFPYLRVFFSSASLITHYFHHLHINIVGSSLQSQLLQVRSFLLDLSLVCAVSYECCYKLHHTIFCHLLHINHVPLRHREILDFFHLS